MHVFWASVVQRKSQDKWVNNLIKVTLGLQRGVAALNVFVVYGAHNKLPSICLHVCDPPNLKALHVVMLYNDFFSTKRA